MRTIASSTQLLSKTIVIVGGGPAGLACAIEAHFAGVEALVIEKRDSYIRPQALFLNEETLNLLNKWQVELPLMKTFEDKVGVVRLNALEEGLKKRVELLGIVKLHGEFTRLDPNVKKIFISTDKVEIELDYDLLVGTDGAHSHVRKELGIDSCCMGEAFGALAVVNYEVPLGGFDTEVKVVNDLFTRRISWGLGSVIFVQGSSEAGRQALNSDARKVLQDLSLACGWIKDAEIIQNDKALFRTDIEIALRQALTFSDKRKGAILVGDSAATASLFQGKGANTALFSAKIAGDFFKDSDYEKFNQAMKEVTDQLIQDSQFLFPTSD